MEGDRRMSTYEIGKYKKIELYKSIDPFKVPRIRKVRKELYIPHHHHVFVESKSKSTLEAKLNLL